MEKNGGTLLFMALIAGLTIVTSCRKEVNSPENEMMPANGNMMLKSASIMPDYRSLSIMPGSEMYYKRTESNIVSWGGKSGTSNSRIVEVEYYNTETEFILKVKSTGGWSDLIINGSAQWKENPVAANEWGTYRISLVKGWKAGDQINYELNVIGDGPQATFTVSYKLIGICSHCREQFSYERNFDGTYTFSYTPSEDYTNANLEFNFARSEKIIVSGLPGWNKEGQTKQKTMNLVKCQTYEWIVGLCPKSAGYSENGTFWTDFKVNNVSKKNISEPTPNITSDCP